MSLTRKLLTAMGIEAEKVDEIINAHSETVEALKKERDAAKEDAEQYKEAAEKLPGVQKELDKLKEEAGKHKPDEYEEKYNTLKEEYDKFKNEIEEKESFSKKTEAYRNLLKEAGISEKRINSVLKVSDVKGVELDKDGKIKGADKLTETVKTEWADFITTEHEKGADTSTPPEGNGGDAGKGTPSRAAQRAAEYHTNLYGEAK